MAIINGKDSWAWQDADYLYGTSSADTINLFAGGGVVIAGAGNDTVDGGYGDDEIEGDEGSDTLKGSYGDDDLSGDAGADVLYGGMGDDTLYGNAYYGGTGDLGDKLYGGEGYDWLIGGAGADIMDGGNGDDIIEAGVGSDLTGDKINGGAGIDRLVASYKLSGAAVTFTATDYRNVLSAPGGFTVQNVEQYEIRGSDFADRITGWEMDDELMGGKGNDQLSGLGGDDFIYGAYGADTIRGGNGDDILDGDETGYYDWNEPTAPYGADTIYGGRGDDSADGGAMNDLLYGEDGNDSLDGEDGNDRVDGGQGWDVLEGGNGVDSVYGGSGDDELYSERWLVPDDGTEFDILEGGAGNDEIWAGVGDKAIGGDQAGTRDLIHLTFDALPSNSPKYATGVTYNLATQGQVLTTLANGTQLDGFEMLHFDGGAGTDRVTGGAYEDYLSGGKGNDSLYGNSGNDVLDGEDGADFLDGGMGHDTFHDSDADGVARSDTYNGNVGNDILTDGRGSDTLNGGAGDDEFNLGSFLRPEDYLADFMNGNDGVDAVDYSDADLSVFLDLMTQTANAGAARNDRFTGIEHFEGSTHDDYLLGDAAANSFDGGAQDDVLNGRGGNDILAGGAGSDDLTGGVGKDTFVLELDDGFLDHDTYWPHDTIRDFSKADDKLRIDESEFSVDAFNFKIVNQATNATTLAGPTFIFETDTKRLWFDEDGKGVDTDRDGVVDQNADAVLIATIGTVTSLDKSNFSFFDL